jgi:hypothetical protein
MQRLLAACWLFLSIGCGGVQKAEDKVMQNWPKVPTNAVAGAAAGAAALMTVANPASVRKPEAPQDPSRMKAAPTEQMPGSVLDHLDDQPGNSTKPVPCRRPVPAYVAPDPSGPKEPDCQSP